jgi:hypothetical protein
MSIAPLVGRNASTCFAGSFQKPDFAALRFDSAADGSNFLSHFVENLRRRFSAYNLTVLD